MQASIIIFIARMVAAHNQSHLPEAVRKRLVAAKNRRVTDSGSIG